MLTVAAIQSLLETVEYRPGWTLTCYDDEFEGPHLCIYAIPENSYQPGTRTDLDIRSPLPPFDSEADFLRWLSWRLRRVEIHESMEWLRIGGKPVYDPHTVHT